MNLYSLYNVQTFYASTLYFHRLQKLWEENTSSYEVLQWKWKLFLSLSLHWIESSSLFFQQCILSLPIIPDDPVLLFLLPSGYLRFQLLGYCSWHWGVYLYVSKRKKNSILKALFIKHKKGGYFNLLWVQVGYFHWIGSKDVLVGNTLLYI